MKLTGEILAPYKGGQMEFYNEGVSGFDYCRRGEIKDLVISGHILEVAMLWLADKGNDSSWRISGYHCTRQIDLSKCNVSDPVRRIRGGKAIFIDFYVLGQKIVLYSRDGEKLNPYTISNFNVLLPHLER